jgi:hypothetical protein
VRILKHWRCAAAAALAAEFALPWARTGHRERSLYNLAGVLHDTRIVPNRLIGVVVFCVLVMPVLAAITIAADLADVRRLASGTLLATATLVAVVVAAVRFAQPGPRVAAATVVLVVALSAREMRLRDVDRGLVVADE